MTCNGDCNQGRECICECKKETNMTKHKWHKEIKAWADGEEVEYTWGEGVTWCRVPNISAFDEITLKFRIKLLPKEPKYLYAIQTENKGVLGGEIRLIPAGQMFSGTLIGKIEVQDD